MIRKQVKYVYLKFWFVAFLWAIVGFQSCYDKMPEVSPQVAPKQTAESLAKSYFSPMNEEAFQEWYEGYQQLSYDEMEIFNEHAAQQALLLIGNREKNASQKVAFAKSLRTRMNQQAMQRFGKPLNQLENKLANELAAEIWAGPKEKHTRPAANPACGCEVYSLHTKPGGYAPQTNEVGRQRRANYPECDDCDLEVLFPPRKSVLKYTNGAGALYYTYGKGKYGYRKSTMYTHLLIGYGAVNAIFFGSEVLAAEAFRME